MHKILHPGGPVARPGVHIGRLPGIVCPSGCLLPPSSCGVRN
jgi:hypothetical protein